MRILKTEVWIRKENSAWQVQNVPSVHRYHDLHSDGGVIPWWWWWCNTGRRTYSCNSSYAHGYVTRIFDVFWERKWPCVKKKRNNGILLTSWRRVTVTFEMKPCQVSLKKCGAEINKINMILPPLATNLICVWPCIIDVGKPIYRNQIDATITIYLSPRSAQHISGNLLPIFRSVRLRFLQHMVQCPVVVVGRGSESGNVARDRYPF